MDLEEQQSLQILREQNLLLLEQLREGQHKMRHILAPDLSTIHNLGNASLSSTTLQPIEYIPKKNVSFSENDLSCVFGLDEYRQPELQNSKTSPVPKHPKRSKSPKSRLAQGVLGESKKSTKEMNNFDRRTESLSSTPDSSFIDRNETPRSILKRRKIIDDNITVDSKFAHTPTFGRSPKDKRGLNFSYSDYDDLNYGLGAMTVNECTTDALGKHRYSDATDGSYIEEYLDTSVGDVEKDIKDIQARKTTSARTSRKDKVPEVHAREVEALLRERLVKDSGNDREKAKIVRDLSKRPTSKVFDSSVEPRVILHKSSKSSREAIHNGKTAKNDSLQGSGPLLGYDWIAGVLENDSVVMNNSDAYFEDIKTFRKENTDVCNSTTFNGNMLDLTKPISPNVKSPTHTCIHGYTISNRLFTEPMNTGEDGLSVCPVCLISRKEPRPDDPGFVRVSIPRSTLESPYRVRPHRRRSFDPTDSCALSKHCLAGWESSKPSQIPTASNVDLKQASQGIKAKCSQTIGDAEREAMSFSRGARLFSGPPVHKTLNSSAMYEPTKPDPANSVKFNRSVFTEALLNTSHGLRYDLQQLEQTDDLAVRNPPHSTKYPLL